MGRGPAVALAAIVVALAAVPTRAANVKVAGPTPSGATLVTYHEDGGVCLEIVRHGESFSSSCGETPYFAADTEVIESEGTYVAGAAPPMVVRAQAVQADGTATDVPLQTGPGGLRYFLWEYDPKPHGYLKFVRLFDAAGTELAAVSDGDIPSSPPVDFGRLGGLRVVAYEAHEFEPSPIDLERVRNFLCVGVRRARGSEDLVGGCLLREAVSDDVLDVHAANGTCGHGDAVVAFADARVARVVMVLGSGRRMFARPRPIPLDPPEGRRAFVLIATRKQAVRRVEALGASGQRIAQEGVGLEPATGACSSGLLLLGASYDIKNVVTRSDAPPPGGPSLAVRVDGGERLCVGVDEAPTPGYCMVPANFALFADAERDYGDGSRAFAGLVDAGVATVTVRLRDGGRVSAPTFPAPDSAGPYQAVARGYVIHVPGRAISILYSDVAGHLLWAQNVDSGLGAVSPRVVLRDGATRLAVGLLRSIPRYRQFCGELVTGRERISPAGCRVIDRRVSSVEVSCATRRIAIFGRVGRTPRAVEAIGSSGRHYAGAIDRRTRAFLIVLPSNEGLRELHVVGPRGYRAPEVLPSGAAQCGYGTTIFGNLL
jgi:hypothetical protein